MELQPVPEIAQRLLLPRELHSLRRHVQRHVQLLLRGPPALPRSVALVAAGVGGGPAAPQEPLLRRLYGETSCPVLLRR